MAAETRILFGPALVAATEKGSEEVDEHEWRFGVKIHLCFFTVPNLPSPLSLPYHPNGTYPVIPEIQTGVGCPRAFNDDRITLKMLVLIENSGKSTAT
jgi:hypothetical protein